MGIVVKYDRMQQAYSLQADYVGPIPVCMGDACHGMNLKAHLELICTG